LRLPQNTITNPSFDTALAHHIHGAAQKLLKFQQKRCTVQKTPACFHINEKINIALPIVFTASNRPKNPYVSRSMPLGRLKNHPSFFSKQYTAIHINALSSSALFSGILSSFAIKMFGFRLNQSKSLQASYIEQGMISILRYPPSMSRSTAPLSSAASQETLMSGPGNKQERARDLSQALDIFGCGDWI
jgi:hypothetical protein